MRFRRNKVPAVLAADMLAGRIAGLIKGWQLRAAVWLNQRTQGYSPSRWRLLLLLFCLSFGGASFYLIISSIYY